MTVEATQNEWADKLNTCLGLREKSKHVTFIGVGNPVKSDDSVGLYLISKLRKKYGADPSKFVTFERETSSVNLFSTMERRRTRRTKRVDTIIILDAIEANIQPGSIIFENIRGTKFGFFVTHNVPLRILHSVSSNAADVFVLGVQVENIEVGENLSQSVSHSAETIIDKISQLIEAA